MIKPGYFSNSHPRQDPDAGTSTVLIHSGQGGVFFLLLLDEREFSFGLKTFKGSAALWEIAQKETLGEERNEKGWRSRTVTEAVRGFTNPFP